MVTNSYEDEEFIAVHAGLISDKMEENTPEILLWDRSVIEGGYKGKIAIGGHTPMKQPVLMSRRFLYNSKIFISSVLGVSDGVCVLEPRVHHLYSLIQRSDLDVVAWRATACPVQVLNPFLLVRVLDATVLAALLELLQKRREDIGFLAVGVDDERRDSLIVSVHVPVSEVQGEG